MNNLDNLKKCFMAIACQVLSLSFVFIVVGCKTTSTVQYQESASLLSNAPTMSSNEPVQALRAHEKTLTVCQRELMVLSKINKLTYSKKKAEFDNLITHASVYTSVRDDIDFKTKDTLDALYKFKAQKFCSDIELAVRQSLISVGENIK
ncbi:hypothetical protein ACLEW9_13570 [Enterobacter ludwigii]|uniref:hypothetical protein n=1 Tax=Enterobacter ludwigii TaxID=299767 RepID=UPI003976FAA1